MAINQEELQRQAKGAYSTYARALNNDKKGWKHPQTQELWEAYAIKKAAWIRYIMNKGIV